MEQLADDFRHQRCCHTKSGSSSGQQCKDSQKVNQTAANSICLFSQNPRRDMAGGTLYLVGRDARTHELLSDATSCSMCRRLVINAGLEKVVIRKSETAFEVVPVSDWIAEDDLLVPPSMDLN